MIVTCIDNRNTSADDRTDSRRGIGNNVRAPAFAKNITVGLWYTVYALAIRDGGLWYYIADDVYVFGHYPVAYKAVLFDVIDTRVSRYWRVASRAMRSERQETLLAFAEWADDKRFLERLVDGGCREVEIFATYKERMDMEYPLPHVREAAEHVEGNWVVCPKCIEAWESDSTIGMVKCPKCNAVLLNPRYTSSDKR